MDSILRLEYLELYTACYKDQAACDIAMLGCMCFLFNCYCYHIHCSMIDISGVDEPVFSFQAISEICILLLAHSPPLFMYIMRLFMLHFAVCVRDLPTLGKEELNQNRVEQPERTQIKRIYVFR